MFRLACIDASGSRQQARSCRRGAAALTLLGTLVLFGCGGAGQTARLIEIDGLYSRVPSKWREVKQTKPPRIHEFLLRRAKGDSADAQLVVTHYGRGYGGENATDISRWQRHIEAPPESSLDDVIDIRTTEVSGVTVTIVDLLGAYVDREVSPEHSDISDDDDDVDHSDGTARDSIDVIRRHGYRLIGVVFASRHGPYFMRLVGPEMTVARHLDDFEAWLQGFSPPI